MIVRLSAMAERDLSSVLGYLNRVTGSTAAALRLVGEFDQVLDRIGENPFIGRERTELSRGLRGHPHGEYIIFWRIKRNVVQIVRIMHQKQDIARAFNPHKKARE